MEKSRPLVFIPQYVTIPSMHSELVPQRALALAVVHRAVQDLTISHDRDSAQIRIDAYNFLTHRLWGSDCMWNSILEGCLVQRHVIDLVHRKVRRLPTGLIEVIR